MGTFKSDQKGFGVIETLMAIVIIVLIGAAGWLVYKNHSKTHAVAKADKSIKAGANGIVLSGSTPDQSQFNGWQSFCSSYGGLCLKYPASWKLSQASNTPGTNPNGQEVDTITSPSGNVTVTYRPGAQVSGDRQQENINVVSATQASGSGLAVIKMINQLSTSQYAVEYFVTLSSAAHALNKTNSPFTTGSTITDVSEPPYHQFTNPLRPDDIGQQLLAVTISNGDPGANFFTSSANAQAWLNSSEVQTAGQILASVNFSQ